MPRKVARCLRPPHPAVLPPSSPVPAESDPSRWFVEQVQPHEGALRSYLKRQFPKMRDVDDVVQESFLRIWKARAGRPIRSGGSFLFSIARHLAIDILRREKRNATHEPVTEIDLTTVLDSRPDLVETVSTHQEMTLLVEAIDALPPRCREIIILRKLDGLSHREIAVRLGISEETVQVQVGRGMEKCHHFLRNRGVAPRSQPHAPAGDNPTT